TRLDPVLREKLAGATVLHSVSGVDPGEGAETEARHPLIRRQPETGAEALFLTVPERLSELTLADGSDASDLLPDLYAASTEDEAQWLTFDWTPGALLFWDNRITLHKGDHRAVEGTRTLHRGMVRGEVPVAA
ncbi:MAG: TauD/TfdA dioxygenase family protein, partial [Shimia sp.]